MSSAKGDWQAELWHYANQSVLREYTSNEILIEFFSNRLVVFGRSYNTDKWHVIFSGDSVGAVTAARAKESFNAQTRNVTEATNAQVWCLVWIAIPRGGRKVLTVFSDKWMVYDRYGQFMLNAETSNSSAAFLVVPISVTLRHLINVAPP